ncbi:MAG: hypothetical protein ACON4Z_17160 [Planctomycetota bacterium]
MSCPRAATVALTGLLLVCSCTHRATEEVAGRLPIPAGVTSIRLEMDNGTLDVAALLEGAVRDQVTFEGGVRMDAADGAQLAALEEVDHLLVADLDPEDPSVLRIQGPRLPQGVAGMIAYEGHVRVPPELPLEVVVRDNGHVTMVGRRASSRVRTRRGDLRFDDCKGGVKAQTGQGNVIAYDHGGDLDVRSQNGDMQAFVVEPGAVVTLKTGKGTVQCYLPPDLPCTVDARAEIGRIGSDFGFEVTKPTAYSSAMIGSRGGRTTRVLLRTASGHIAMRALAPR